MNKFKHTTIYGTFRNSDLLNSAGGTVNTYANAIFDGTLKLIGNLIVNNGTTDINITPTELTQLEGISSNIQTQLNSKLEDANIQAIIETEDHTITSTYYFDTLPYCNQNPTIADQVARKAYVDLSITNATNEIETNVGTQISTSITNALTDYYDIATTNNLLDGKANASALLNYYDITTTDTLLNAKANVSALSDYFNKTTSNTISGVTTLQNHVNFNYQSELRFKDDDNITDVCNMYYSTTDNRLNISIASGSSLYCTRDIITPLNILCNNISVSSATGITKSMVGLANVDNTTDLNKPISTSTQTALDLKANLSSPTFSGTVNGITKSMVGLSNVDNTSDANKPISSATQTALDLKANLSSPTFSGTVNGITKTMVGLGNADNTSDANKPISSATQTALDLKVNATNGEFENTVTFKNSSGIDFINTGSSNIIEWLNSSSTSIGHIYCSLSEYAQVFNVQSSYLTSGWVFQNNGSTKMSVSKDGDMTLRSIKTYSGTIASASSTAILGYTSGNTWLSGNAILQASGGSGSYIFGTIFWIPNVNSPTYININNLGMTISISATSGQEKVTLNTSYNNVSWSIIFTAIV